MNFHESDIINSNAPILLCFSVGKDSVAMVLHLFELGVDKSRIHLHHHNVDGMGENLFDWACTESYVRKFADYFGLKLFISYRKGGIIREMFRENEAKQDVYFQKEDGGIFFIAPSDKKAINTRLKFPAVSVSLITRWCSATVKIEVLRTAIAHNENYLGKIFILTGERRQESTNRSKYEKWEFHQTNAKKREAISCRLIIDWTEEQVWSIMKRWNIQPHPAYMLGYSRCSCQLCIFSSSSVWAITNRINKEKILRIADIEKSINHTLYHKKTIIDAINYNAHLDLDEYWIKQATGKFTADIITMNWVLPKGAFGLEISGAA